MDYKLIRESFFTNKSLLNASYNQSVELDSILPDYYPEIFKILNVSISPYITKQSVIQSKLSYELLVKIKLIYLSEDGTISDLSQELVYNKSVELPYNVKNPCISIMPYTDSESVRVVNKRRVDIRGIIVIDINASANEQKQAISKAYGEGLQLKDELLTYPAKRICLTKRITVIDEVDLGGKNALKSLLKSDICITSLDKKVLSSKLLVKGVAEITATYLEEDTNEISTLKFSLPFSQVCDIEGLDEGFNTFINAYPSGIEIKPISNSQNNSIECELSITLSILALKFESAQIATDAFSTQHETLIEKEAAIIELMPIEINDSIKLKSTLAYAEGEIAAVISSGAEVDKISLVCDTSNEATITGLIKAYAFALNDSGKLIYLSTSLPFEHKLSYKCEDASSAEIYACISASSYNLSSSNALEVTTDIKLSGLIFESKIIEYIDNIILDESSDYDEDDDCAIKLYFAQAGESIWDIAKKTHASMDAIIDENDLEGARITADGMILIPIC